MVESPSYPKKPKKITQYERSLRDFSSLLIKIILIALLTIFALKILIIGHLNGIYPTALFVIALAITIVPEALPVIATVTLSLGVLKLAKQHVVCKSLSAAEDLGNVNILCTDKTGTLTENKMVIVDAISEDELLFKKIAFTSSIALEKFKKDLNPYSDAILNYLPNSLASNNINVLKEVPFDPTARRSRLVLKIENDTYLLSIGSSETLLEIAETSKKDEYLLKIKEDGLKGLRHFGYAYKKIDYNSKMDLIKEEKNLKFLGFFTLEDPLRKTALSTVKLAEKLGIAIKILSGDSPEVVAYIAQKVGLLKEGAKVFQGDELDKLSDDELKILLNSNSAFARLNPEQKFRIIRILKKENVVAYQGDGINDAPALKLADVAIAVNNATDIAKENADIVLLRKDLGVIINGLKNGRVIFTNINKYIRYTMVGNFGNFFALGILFLFAKDLPLTPVQLLLTSLLTDLPLLAISTDFVSHSELLKPRHISINKLMRTSLFLGAITTIFILFFYFIARFADINLTQTNLFLFFTVSQLMIIFSVRGKDYFWHSNRLSLPLTVSIFLTLLIAIAMIYIPWTQNLFTFVKLPLIYLMIILLFTVIYLLALDSSKIWLYKYILKVDYGNT